MKEFNFKNVVLIVGMLCLICNNYIVYAQMNGQGSEKVNDGEKLRKLCVLYERQSASLNKMPENIGAKKASKQSYKILTGNDIDMKEAMTDDLAARVEKDVEKRAAHLMNEIVSHISSGKNYEEASDFARNNPDFAVALSNALREKRTELDNQKKKIEDYGQLSLQYKRGGIKLSEWAETSRKLEKEIPGSVIWQDKNNGVPKGASQQVYDIIKNNIGNVDNALNSLVKVCGSVCNTK